MLVKVIALLQMFNFMLCASFVCLSYLFFQVGLIQANIFIQNVYSIKLTRPNKVYLTVRPKTVLSIASPSKLAYLSNIYPSAAVLPSNFYHGKYDPLYDIYLNNLACPSDISFVYMVYFSNVCQTIILCTEVVFF